MDAYGGKLKLTEMWVARHGGTEQGEMCCVFGRVGEGEICDVFLQVVIMCGSKKKSRAMGRREGREHTIIIHRKWLLGSVSPGETWENPASGAPVRVNGLAKCWEVSEPKW